MPRTHSGAIVVADTTSQYVSQSIDGFTVKIRNYQLQLGILKQRIDELKQGRETHRA